MNDDDCVGGWPGFNLITEERFNFSMPHNGRRQCPRLRTQVVEQEQKLHSDRFISGRGLAPWTAHWPRQGTQLRCE